MLKFEDFEFEEEYNDEAYEQNVFYFILPKSYMSEIDFDDIEDYGNVVSMCVSLTVPYSGRDYYMQMSPTVEEEFGLEDVDWRDLYLDFNYTDDLVAKLIELAKSHRINKSVKEC